MANNRPINVVEGKKGFQPKLKIKTAPTSIPVGTKNSFITSGENNKTNLSFNIGILWKLVENKSLEERLEVLNNIVEQISIEDAQKFQKEYLEYNDKFVEDIYRKHMYPWRYQTLTMFSKHVSPTVRWIVAVNQNTSPEILDYLSQDKSGKVRLGVINNNSTLISTLQCLKDKEWSPVLKYALSKRGI